MYLTKMNSQTVFTVFHNTFPNWELALKYMKSYGSYKYWMFGVVQFTKERPISLL